MKKLVSGASGFVGRILSRQLADAGFSVRALLRRDSKGPWDEVTPCDLGADIVPTAAMQDVDTVFHLAGVAHAWGIPDEVYRMVNIDGTRRLVDAAVAMGVKRFVYFSSVKAVADPRGTECVDERWLKWPDDAYGRSKREAEEILLDVARKKDMHVVVLRPALVYGPGVRGNLLKFMQLVDSGFCPPLPDTGNRRSMVHVEELCTLAIRVAEEPVAAGKCYMVADPEPYTTRALYTGLCSSLGRPIPSWTMPSWGLRMVGRVGDLGSMLVGRPLPFDSRVISRLLDSACYSAKLCQSELDWEPRHDLMGSLPAMVAAWQKEINGKAQ